MGPDEFLTLAEIAEELKIPLATVHQWRYRGLGPIGHRVGRHIRVRRSDLEAWIAERRDQPSTAVR